VNMHVKLLSSDPFSAKKGPKCSKYLSAAGLPPDPLGEHAPLSQTP